MMNRIKLNDLKSTEIHTANLLAVATDMREFINDLSLLEKRWVIDCELKNDDPVALQYNYSDLASCKKDFELLANLEHVTVYFK
jgi:hypothetical protein